jgi:hypothetical protein
MKSIFIILFLTLLSLNAESQDSVKLYGMITDFNGNPLDSVSVRLKNRKFENVYETITGNDGRFSLQVTKGVYYCLYAIKLSDYRKTKLEYWAWNVPLFDNLEINPRYDNMEIYGINVFEPQVTPQETYRIYFRPMSLKKGNPLRLEKGDTINMAPETITPGELEIRINGSITKIMSISKVTEYARGNFFYGYDVQVLKPEQGKSSLVSTGLPEGYDKISIVLKSVETGEIGTADAFVER